jgi:hypothetical protein
VKTGIQFTLQGLAFCSIFLFLIKKPEKTARTARITISGITFLKDIFILSSINILYYLNIIELN